jgi:mRNA interferase MazF
MAYKTGTVVIVPFPFTDRHSKKRRPAVLISKPAYERETGHVVLLMITSAKQSAWLSDTPITAYEAVGLPNPCVVRQKIFTLDVKLVLAEKGLLAQQDWECLCLKVQDSLAIQP